LSLDGGGCLATRSRPFTPDLSDIYGYKFGEPQGRFGICGENKMSIIARNQTTVFVLFI